MFAYDQRDQLQSREAVKFPSFERCIQTEIVSVPPVNSIAHGGHIGSVMMMMMMMVMMMMVVMMMILIMMMMMMM